MAGSLEKFYLLFVLRGWKTANAEKFKDCSCKKVQTVEKQAVLTSVNLGSSKKCPGR